jgi:L-ascorbate metabolism protein UlaG (beta-lactamase superfamily)
MRGGPFIDYDRPRIEEITALIEATKCVDQNLIALSSSIATLDTLLQSEAKGYSLQTLYEKVPTILRGYVELVYDLNGHPSFRFIEPLLYRGFYNTSTQSLMLSTTTGDERPFVLSTPRFESPDALHIRRPFNDEAVDWIFQSKLQSRRWADICDMLGLSDEQQSHFRSMFTEVPSQQYTPYTGAGIRWRYFGHACILIETPTVSILFDPVLSYTYESGISRYTYEDLPDKIDYVVITHNHQDHILFETLLQIRHKTRTIVVPGNRRGALYDPSLKLILQNTGFKGIVELQELETISFEGGSITGLPFFGEHADLDIHSKLGYQVRVGELSLLVLADSCNLEPLMYENLREVVGNVTALFLGMECDGAPLSWLYGPLLTRPIERNIDASRRLAGCNYDQAVDIVRRFNPRHVYVYAMGQEPWLNYIMSIKYTEESRPIVESNRLINECRGNGIRAERLFGEKEIRLEEC